MKLKKKTRRIILKTSLLCAVLLLSTISFLFLSTNSYGASSTDSWPMFRHNPQHTGFSNATAPVDNKTTALMWLNSTDGIIGFSSPAIYAGYLFIGAKDGYMYAFNATSGHRIWKSEDFLGIEIESSPAVADGTVFVGSTNGTFYALNASTGKTLWSLKLGSQIWSSPTIAGGRVYVASMNVTKGTVYALDFNGTVIWRNSTASSNFKSSPAVAGGKLFIGSLDGVLHIFDAENGNLLNSTNLGGQIVYSSPAVSNGKVFVGVSLNTLYALNASNGEIIWKNFTQGRIDSSPAVAYGKVFVGCEDGKLYAFNENTGEQVWNFTTDGGAINGTIYSSPAVANGAVFFGSCDYKIYALNASTGEELWSYQTNGEVWSSPAIANGMVFIGAKDGKVYAFGKNSPPIASFIFSPTEAEVNQTVVFNASASMDPDPLDQIINYTWNFGDGNITTTKVPIIIHKYIEGGEYNVTLTVTDSHGAQNSTTKPLKVKKHEVVILEVKPEQVNVTKGETLNINVTIKNQGDYNENVTVTAWCSNGSLTIPVSKVQNVFITINETKWLILPWDTTNFTRGTYHISATVDNVKKEDGNVIILVHDLILIDMVVNATVVRINQTVLIGITVKNDGDFTEGNITVTVYANSTLIGENSTTSLVGGAYWYSTINWNTTNFSLGNYLIEGSVTKVLDEVNYENNNFTFGTILVRPPFHDVSVLEISPSKLNATRGETLEVTVSLTNQGEYQSENVTVTLWYSNNTTPQPINMTYLIVEKGEIKNVTFYWDTTGFSGGYYIIGAYANITHDDFPDNNNKTNDEVLILIPFHDLQIAEVTPARPKAFLGRQMPIYVLFENIGNYSMESFRAYAYYNETLFDWEIIPSLNPGEYQIWEAIWDPPSIGNFSIKIYAEITDDNPLNNNQTITIEVIEPIHDIAINWAEPVPYVDQAARGKQISITVEIENQGAYDEVFTLNLYANMTSIANITLIGTQDVQLNYLASPLNVTFTWNTTAFIPEIYQIFVNITSLPQDQDISDNYYANGIIEILPGVHDIAITSPPMPYPTEKNILCLSPSSDLILTANISLFIQNKGTFTEHANITIYLIDRFGHQTLPVGNLTVSNILPDEARRIMVPISVLNNSGIEKGAYYIKASVEILNDANPNDNNLTSIWLYLTVAMTGDIANNESLGIPDGKVDILDVAQVAARFGRYAGEEPAGALKYHAVCDLYYDGKIDIMDAAIVAAQFGKYDP